MSDNEENDYEDDEEEYIETEEDIFVNEVTEDLSKHSSYAFMQILGQGAQARVIKALRDDDAYAVKVFSIGSEQDFNFGDRGEGLSDINFSLLLKHPHIITAYEFILGDKFAYVVMKFADRSLDNFLLDKPSHLVRSKIIFDLGCAIQYIHDMQLVHCDVKSFNALMIGPTYAVLSDFGLVRHREDNTIRGCQTYNYVSPEILHAYGDLSKYESMFKHKDVNKWINNQTAAEIWSYGILCLEIIYARPSMTYERYYINKSSYAKKHGRLQDPYVTLINIFLHEKEHPMEKVIMDIFGKREGDLLVLLRLVCSKLLVIDQDERVNSYSEFLSNRYFRDKNMVKTDADFSLDVKKAQLPLVDSSNPLYVGKRKLYIDTTTEWMAQVAKELELSPLVIMNSIDFFLQKIDKYVQKTNVIQLLACVSMWLVSNVNLLDSHSIDEYINLTDDAYKRSEMITLIKHILRGENGCLKYESLYSHIPSRELLEKAMPFMLNIDVYEGVGGPSGLASYLLQNETEEELSNRTPKSIEVLDYDSIIEQSKNIELY